MVPATFEGFVAIIKNLQYNFPKTRGGGLRPFGTFPKKHHALIIKLISYLKSKWQFGMKHFGHKLDPDQFGGKATKYHII